MTFWSKSKNTLILLVYRFVSRSELEWLGHAVFTSSIKAHLVSSLCGLHRTCSVSKLYSNFTLEFERGTFGTVKDCSLVTVVAFDVAESFVQTPTKDRACVEDDSADSLRRSSEVHSTQVFTIDFVLVLSKSLLHMNFMLGLRAKCE